MVQSQVGPYDTVLQYESDPSCDLCGRSNTDENEYKNERRNERGREVEGKILSRF